MKTSNQLPQCRELKGPIYAPDTVDMYTVSMYTVCIQSVS